MMNLSTLARQCTNCSFWWAGKEHLSSSAMNFTKTADSAARRRQGFAVFPDY